MAAEFVWNWTAVPGAIAFALACLLAVVVLAANAQHRQNRRLALLLFLEAMTWGVGAGLIYFSADPATVYGGQAVFVTACLALPFAYLLFLASVDCSLTLPLKPRAVQATLVAVALVAEALFFLNPQALIPGLVQPPYAPYDAIIPPVFRFVVLGLALVQAYAVAVAIQVVREARDPLARRRAKLYAVAFLTHDIFLIVDTVFLTSTYVSLTAAPLWAALAIAWGANLAVIVLTVLLGYGILQAQLFDIDLRIKWSVRRGTVAAIFLAVFLVVSEVAQGFFSQELGWAAGGVAAGLLLFAAGPVERVADRVANAAMPRVHATDEYLTFRKLEVYKSALLTAHAGGSPTTRELAMLAKLRAELGIDPLAARALEEDLAALGGPVAGTAA